MNGLGTTRAQPFVREAGTGPGVVCIHSNAASSSQWRGLMDRLAPSFRVLAPDSYGAGKSPEWPSDRMISLADEVALIEPVIAAAGAPVVLVGHSYGGAVALMAALAHPGRIRALALYEPTLFSLLDPTVSPNPADGIRDAVARSAAALEVGDADAAAGHFIDYWMGAGSWAQTPALRKPPIVASIVNVRRWAHALTTEPTPLSSFQALDVPVLLMTGQRSPLSSLAVAARLAPVLPRVEQVEFDGMGHMGPITHADRVNDTIAGFLARL